MPRTTAKTRRAGVLFYLDPADRLKLKTLAAIHGTDYAGVVTRLVRAERERIAMDAASDPEPEVRVVTHLDIEGHKVALVTERWADSRDCPCRSHYDSATDQWYTQRAVNLASGEVYEPAENPWRSSLT